MASILDSFPFAVFVLSVLLTKLVHLHQHANSVSGPALVFYLPTFFVPDVVLISVQRILLRRERGVVSLFGYFSGVVITLITLGAAASQLGFYLETGGEIEWEEASAFAGDKEGIKVLLDGTASVALSAFLILAVAWPLKSWLYLAVGRFLVTLGHYVLAVVRLASRTISEHRPASLLSVSSYHSDSGSYSSDASSDYDAHEGQRFLEEGKEKFSERWQTTHNSRKSLVITVTLLLSYLVTTTLLRPTKPYGHMSTTLPLPLLDIFKSETIDPCEEQVLLSQNEWPFPNQTLKAHWQKPRGNFKGWTPGHDSKPARAYKNHHPDWLPQPAPDGFFRWDPEVRHESEFVITPEKDGNNEPEVDPAKDACAVNMTDDNFYSPVTDPLRISNLDSELLEPLREVFKDGKVKIQHVMFVLMESTREELFPIQQGSDIHRIIMETHDEAERDEINGHLSRLTPNAERITGKSGKFMDTNGSRYDEAVSQWSSAPSSGFGGINIVGGLTPSSVSTKSLAALHCGAWPLPVDHFEEASLQSYQPCLPQIMNLLNRGKASNSSSNNFLDQQWEPAFFQATTDNYDHQDEFDNKIGLSRKVTKVELEQRRLEGYLEEINYFGYPEQVLKPYMEEFIDQTLAAKKRIFLSHFTSSTHHAWGVPKDFNKLDYLNQKGGARWHKDLNKYLNTVHLVDSWLGEMMQMLENKGIANETLVVFVGDHGQAFQEDTVKSGTYENGHISNFRVPITLHHPHIPRVQYEANATSVSILPTVLDLLINTNSLNEQDLAVASDIIHDYEGQSLLRPYRASQDGRRAWNFGLVNSGGGMLTITSADAPWRLVVPLDMDVAYIFTDVRSDPLELDPVSKWTLDELLPAVEGRFGADAAGWAGEADAVARWWILERKRLWGYNRVSS